MIPLPLQNSALIGVEILINRALQYDPATRNRLSELTGRSICIELTSPALTMYLACHQDNITLHSELNREPDVSIKGSATALINIAMADDPTIAGKGVEVRGSLDVLQHLKNALSDLDVDWEAALSELVGELPAHLLIKAARSAHQWQQQARPRVMAAAANFARDEARLTPARDEVEQFRRDVRTLGNNVDRLAARVQRLKSKLQATDQKQ